MCLSFDGMPVDSYVEKGILTDISDVVDEVKASDGLVDSIVKDSSKGWKDIYDSDTFLSIIYHVRSADGRCRKVHAGTCRPHRNPGKGQKYDLCGTAEDGGRVTA